MRSARAKATGQSARRMTKEYSEQPPKVQAQLRALGALPDEDIDTTDIPEITDWSGAQRGGLHEQRPSVLEIIDGGPEQRLFETADEVRAYLAEEKASWDG